MTRLSVWRAATRMFTALDADPRLKVTSVLLNEEGTLGIFRVIIGVDHFSVHVTAVPPEEEFDTPLPGATELSDGPVQVNPRPTRINSASSRTKSTRPFSPQADGVI